MKPLVYIIVLNYNNYLDTISCIESLNRVKYDNHKVVIVDNDSKNDSYKILKNYFKDIKIIKNECNSGYAGGNNLGIKYAINKSADILCILNNDTEIIEDFLTPLVERLVNNSYIGFIGPKNSK